MLLAAAMVAVGVILERRQGNMADDVADQIRINLQIRNMALTLMASGREAQMLDTPELSALKSLAFAKIKVYVEFPQQGNPFGLMNFDQESWECERGITSTLMKAGWLKTTAPACSGQCAELPAMNIEVWSPRLPGFDPFCSGYGHIPKPLPKAADINACMGAEALVAYLKSVGIAAGHSPSMLVPSGSIVIVVGKRLKAIDPEGLVNLEKALGLESAVSRE